MVVSLDEPSCILYFGLRRVTFNMVCLNFGMVNQKFVYSLHTLWKIYSHLCERKMLMYSGTSAMIDVASMLTITCVRKSA